MIFEVKLLYAILCHVTLLMLHVILFIIHDVILVFISNVLFNAILHINSL